MDAGTPLYLTPMVRAWRCRKRGLCCKYQGVQIDEVERRRLERKLRDDGDPLAERLGADVIERAGGWPILPRDGERCVFLGEDDLCRVRTHLGEALYPQVCRKFPYLSLLTSDRHVVGLSFQCPTALQLLAEEPAFEVVVEPAGEPPVERVAYLGGADREACDLAGRAIGIEAFWSLHWSLFEALRARPEARPFERLAAFAEAITGQALPEPIEMRPALWRQGAFEPSIVAQLEARAGASPLGLPSLWMHIPPQAYALDPLPPLDEDALLTRYLLHRVACPTYYLHACDPRFMLMTLFAMLARHRIERARGFDPLAAVRNLDRFFVHSGGSAAILSGGSTNDAWRAMAALARAAAIP